MKKKKLRNQAEVIVFVARNAPETTAQEISQGVDQATYNYNWNSADGKVNITYSPHQGEYEVTCF